MQSLRDTMCLLLVLLLVPVQTLNLPGDERPRAMGFLEVLNKSWCRPIEQLVNVEGELPDGIEYFYTPSCVPLFRCSGCCNDEDKECYPTIERNIILEMRRSNQYVNLTFVEHEACGVRPKYQYQSNTSTEKPLRDKPRRKKRRRTRRR